MKALKISGVIYKVVRECGPGDLSDLRPFAPVILTPKRLKGQRVTDDRLWAVVEEQCADLPGDMWSEIARSDRREYDARRDRVSRGKSGRRINDRPRGGHFVAVDSEGITVKHETKERKKKGVIEKIEYSDQRTVLWMAGGVDGYQNASIEDKTGRGFNSIQIFDLLLSLPRKFAAREASGKQPIFISFGFGYDLGQIVKDFPYTDGWELHNAKPWGERNNPNVRAHRNRPVLWGDYAIRCVPGKSVTLYRLRNPGKAFKYGVDKDGNRTRSLDWKQRIEIFDAFGFFQMSLVAAIENTPSAVTPDELEIIRAGKKQRGNFKAEDIESVKSYTALELKALVNMMNIQRAGLLTAILDKPIKVKRWHGAGSIAKALLDMYLAEGMKGKERRARVREILGSEVFQGELIDKTADERERVDWVFRAYFGGRVDLNKQGNHRGTIHEYDISSAYPAFIVELPDMTGGYWEKVVNPTREQVESASMVSMFHVRTHGYERDLPFYALPFRTKTGSIYYPPHVEGIYMRDHVIAAIRHYDYFERESRLCHYGINPDGPSLEIVTAWLFHPATDEKPFGWVRGLFDHRVKINGVNPAGGQAIKLGLNSLYGKFAEGVGDQPPLYVSPFFAAAITAGTQRRVVEAALTAPDDIVMFATDGVYSTRPLDVEIPAKKTLGAWEHKVVEAGGVFVQSGVYLLRYKPPKESYADRADEDQHLKCKTRGSSPKEIEVTEGKSYNQAVSIVLGRDIPEYWERGEKVYKFAYSNYLALGISSVARSSWPRIGQWKKTERELKLDATEGKRVLDRGTDKRAVTLRKSRAHKLVSLRSNDLFFNEDSMSALRPPKWLSRWEESELAVEARCYTCETQSQGVGSSQAAPLLGTNLVRLLYLDEAGTDKNAPWMCVAGVLVHGDHEWPKINRRIIDLIEKYIPPDDRSGFVFHATDIYHGSHYFDRRKPEWTLARRMQILSDLAAIINDLHLAVVWGKYQKDTFGVGMFQPGDSQKIKDNVLHQSALVDCLTWADSWLEKFSPSELATVVHEDETSSKGFIKRGLRVLRNADQLASYGLTEEMRDGLGLPLKRIIDTVHFAEKPDARPLQLADLCAFILGRSLKGSPVPEDVLEIIVRHLSWMRDTSRGHWLDEPQARWTVTRLRSLGSFVLVPPLDQKAEQVREPSYCVYPKCL